MTLKISLIQKTLIILFIMCISLFSQEESKDAVVSLINEFQRKNQLEMNRDNYEYINNNVIPKCEEVIKKLKNKEDKKYYEAQVEIIKYELDINRHKYLDGLMNDIKNSDNEIEARLKILDIYHYSDREFDRKKLTGWIPIFGKLSYKQYWEEVRKEYTKELDKKINESIK